MFAPEAHNVGHPPRLVLSLVHNLMAPSIKRLQDKKSWSSPTAVYPTVRDFRDAEHIATQLDIGVVGALPLG